MLDINDFGAPDRRSSISLRDRVIQRLIEYESGLSAGCFLSRPELITMIAKPIISL